MSKVKHLGLSLDMVLSRSGDHYSTDEPFIRFIQDMSAVRFDRIDFCSRVQPAEATAAYDLSPEHFKVIPLPWYDNVTRLWLKLATLLPRARRIFSEHIDTWGLLVACHATHPFTPMALRMARQRGVPAVLWIRGDQITDLKCRLTGFHREAALIAARMAIKAIPRGTPVISMGRDDFDFLPAMGPVHVAYSSKFDEEDLVPLPRPAPRDPGRTRILYVGRIAPEKGLEVLLDAMNHLRATGSGEISLTMVGADFHGSPYGPTFARKIEESHLKDAIRIVGHVPYGEELFRQYDAHDLVVLPSFTEGFPQVILEALVRGVPVVTTPVGGIPRVIRDGENGLLVPPRDPAALATAIDRLARDRSLCDRLARHGQETVRAYTRRAQVDAIFAFLGQCYPDASFTRQD